MVYSAVTFLPFTWPGRNVHFFAASRAAVLTAASPKAPLGVDETTSALCTFPAESTMTLTEMALRKPAVVPAGMLRGRVGATRWMGTGSPILPENVGGAAAGLGDETEAAAGATVGGGKDGVEIAG